MKECYRTLIVLIAFVALAVAQGAAASEPAPQFHALIMKDGKIYKDTMNKRGE